MSHPICVTCGTQFATEQPPDHCPICADERQYIGWDGQQWTTLDELTTGHHTEIRQEEPGLLGIGVNPSFAIGQRALLIQSPGGNVLWDCVSLLDHAAIATVQKLGGIAAIVISHPHFYTSMVEWAHAFQAPILLHSDDRQWVMRPDPAIRFWEGETLPLHDDLTLIHCGGHFSGGTVLHWRAGAGDTGALLSGDTIQVVQDRRWVSFMRSYPNLIPLPAAAVRHILTAVEPFPFQRIYGAWWQRIVATNGHAALRRSAERYLQWIDG